MPAHIKSMLNGVSLHVPVAAGEWRSAPGRASMSPSIARSRIGARWFCSFSAHAGRSGVGSPDRADSDPRQLRHDSRCTRHRRTILPRAIRGVSLERNAIRIIF